MIKLLVLCLLATLVTMKDTSGDTSPEDHPSTSDQNTTAPTEKPTEVTHLTNHSAPTPGTVTVKPPEDTNITHHSTPHQSADTDTQKPPEDTNLTHHSAPHPSAATDGNTTSESTSHTAHPAAPLTCNCTAGAGCHEHHCTTEPSERFCVMTAEDTTLAHGINGVSRTCGDNVELCNRTISITLNEHTYWRSNTTCCHNRDNCNSHSLKAPPADTTQSKLVCPSCFAVSNSTCTPSSVRCAKSETKCINVSGTVENGNSSRPFAGLGCATSSAKFIKNGTTLVFGDATYHLTRITMTAAKDGASQTTRSVPFTFLLSSFVGLLQAKFIY